MAPRPTGPRARPPRTSAAAWPAPRPRSTRGRRAIIASSVSAAASRSPAAKAALAKANCASMSAGRSAAAARRACSSPVVDLLAGQLERGERGLRPAGSAAQRLGRARRARPAPRPRGPAGDQRADQPGVRRRHCRAPSRRSARRCPPRARHRRRPAPPRPSRCSGAMSCPALARRRPTGSLASSWSSICLQLRFAAGVGQVGDRLALEHRIDRRDRAHLELRGDELLLVDVDLGEHHALVGIFGGDLLQHRRQRLARPAPFGPEIEDHEAWSSTVRRRPCGSGRPPSARRG